MLPKALLPEQTMALLDAQPEFLLEIRDRAMFEFFYFSEPDSISTATAAAPAPAGTVGWILRKAW